jgi:hypothetical protein
LALLRGLSCSPGSSSLNPCSSKCCRFVSLSRSSCSLSWRLVQSFSVSSCPACTASQLCSDGAALALTRNSRCTVA